MKKSIYALFCVAVIGSLINVGFIEPLSLSPLFYFSVAGTLFTGLVSFNAINNHTSITIENPLPLYALLALSSYYWLNGFFKGVICINHFYILSITIFFIGIVIAFKRELLTPKNIGLAFLLIAFMESVVCIVQSIGFVESFNANFVVTGTCFNPNITAMFLAMCLPLAMYYVNLNNKKPIRILFVVALMVIFLALYLLKCRTAFLGIVVAFTVFMYRYWAPNINLKDQFSTFKLIVLSVCLLIFFAVLIYVLYHYKIASSEGRIFIWKNCIRLIQTNPIVGSGYGLFEHDYNLVQAQYFAETNASRAEILRAGYTHMSYNELIENIVEGGVIGFLLFTFLLFSLLFNSTSNRNTSFNKIASNTQVSRINWVSIYVGAGIALFVTMCFTNFTIQAIPVMALFACYVACLSTHDFPSKKLPKLTISSAYLFLVGLFSIVLCLLLLNKAKSYHEFTNIYKTYIESRNPRLMERAQKLATDLPTSVYYWRSTANMYSANNDYKNAIRQLLKCSQYSSNPEIFLQLGNAYASIGVYSQAEKYYSIAAHIEPHQLKPRFALLQMYQRLNDTLKIITYANEIVSMPIKVPSKSVNTIKQEANTALTKMRLIHN